MKKCLFITLTLVMSTAFMNAATLIDQLAGKINATVATDGSGNFTSINAALKSVPDNNTTEFVIFVKNGTYTEKVEVPATKTFVTLVGESMEGTIIKYSDANGKGTYPATGEIVSKRNTTIGTSTSHTMLLNAPDFTMMNITVLNAYNIDAAITRNSVTKLQAVAINVHADRITLVHCKFLGFQDTFYTWGYGRCFVKDCYITGCTDYIFGRGTTWFEKCVIHSQADGSNIRTVTAPSHEADYKVGYVFNNCKLTGAASTNKVTNNVYLARPWVSSSATVPISCQVAFLNCDNDKWINPDGWCPWKGVGAAITKDETGSDFSEYNTTGAGFVKATRIGGGTVAPWAAATSTAKQTPRIMDETEYATYSIANAFATTAYVGSSIALGSNWLPTIESNSVYQIVSANTTPLIATAVKNKNAQALSAVMNNNGFSLQVLAEGVANVELYNVSGALLQSGNYAISNGEVVVPAQFEKGIYLYYATINGAKYQGKVSNF